MKPMSINEYSDNDDDIKSFSSTSFEPDFTDIIDDDKQKDKRNISIKNV